MEKTKGTHSVKELANKYKCSIQTFRSKWIKLIPNLELSKKQQILTPKQVSQIIEHLGEP